MVNIPKSKNRTVDVFVAFQPVLESVDIEAEQVTKFINFGKAASHW